MAADGDGALIRAVSAEEVRPLRHQVLRPEQPLHATLYEGDELAETIHLAAFDDDDGDGDPPIGIASLYHEPRAGPAPVDGWRLRGMATAPGARGRGHGVALLAACRDHVARAGAAELWCNARKAAIGFYRQDGFEVASEEFDVPGIGPHVVMVRAVTP